MSVKQDVGSEQLFDAVAKDGIACSTVSDGHVLIFTKQHLEMLLATLKETNKEQCIVFIKRPDFGGAN